MITVEFPPRQLEKHGVIVEWQYDGRVLNIGKPATSYVVPVLSEDVIQWCKENLSVMPVAERSLKVVSSKTRFTFQTPHDAILFKLRWG
jgi:hypothetical protein